MFNTNKSYELNILVNGRPVTEFEHEGNTFIEGRKGSEFEVEFKNKSNKQVLVVPSVDGKSVFTGQTATVDSKGYVVRPYGTIRIPGWTLDSSNVAKFFFEDKDKSYSAAVTQEGEAVVTGVIGVLVFSEVEKPKPVQHHHHHHHYPNQPVWPRRPWPENNPIWTMDSYSDAPQNPTSKGVFRSMAMGATLSASSSVSDAVPLSADASAAPFEMGAGFGQKADFKTQTVEFERGPLAATIQLYYDSRRNLEKRGIVVVKKETPASELPQAFAGLGCTPPAGWQG